MSAPTFGSTHSGCGGADKGAQWAGMQPVAAAEYDPAVAAVYARNFGDHIQAARVEDVDYGAWPALFWLHSSPSCKTASRANNAGGEGPADLSSAEAICRAIRTIRPRRFSLENVWGYRTYASFAQILATLHAEGYAVAFWHLNAADYGVPQTRKRLILVASLDHRPRKPQATHCDPQRIARLAPTDGQAVMSLNLPPWNGWYGAVADIIDTFESTEPAEWQVLRLPLELRESMLVGGGNTNKTIIDSVARPGAIPAASSHRESRDRAFVCHPTDMRTMPVRRSSEPIFTLMSNVGNAWASRAFVIDGQESNSAAGVTNRHAPQPAFTQTASQDKHPARASIGGRWVKCGVQASARWQSFPDDFWLPSSNGLAGMVVGNACPPLLMQKVYEANR